MRSRIIYNPPYGGETVGTRRAVTAYERVARFLEVCTTAPASPKWSQVAAEFDSGERKAVMRLHHFPLVFTRPHTGEVLPFQESEHYPPNSAVSQLLFTLEPKHKNIAPSMSLTACLPFEQADDEFLAYYEAMCSALSYTLPKTRFRLASPNKRGDAEVYRKLKF